MIEKQQYEIIEHMPDSDYRKYPAISKSDLDKIHRSILHFEAPKTEPTKAMLEGTAIHTAILEEDQFRHRYVEEPHWINKRTKAGKEEFAAFQAKNRGAILLNSDQMDRIHAMHEAVHNHPLAGNIFKDGMAEASIFWKEKVIADGLTLPLECKCRPDYITEDREVLVDLKSSQDASMDSFAKSIANFRYHVQASWYLRGWEAATEIRAKFLFVVVESQPPHGVACYTLDEGSLAEGYLHGQADLRKYAKFLNAPAENKFTGYSPQIEEISLPRWAFKEI